MAEGQWHPDPNSLSALLCLCDGTRHLRSQQLSEGSHVTPLSRRVSERLSEWLRGGHSKVCTRLFLSLSTKPFLPAFAQLFLVCSFRMLCTRPRAKHLCKQRDFPQIPRPFLHDIVPKLMTKDSVYCGATKMQGASLGTFRPRGWRPGVPCVLSRSDTANLLQCPLFWTVLLQLLLGLTILVLPKHHSFSSC